MSEILNPIERVTVRGRTIEVRELTWKEVSHVLRSLADNVLTLAGPNNTLVLDREKILAALAANEGLLAWIVEKSTGGDPAWVESLALREFLAIGGVIIDLNLNEEMIVALKKRMSQVTNALGLPTLSVAPSISSSEEVTPLETRIA